MTAMKAIHLCCLALGLAVLSAASAQTPPPPAAAPAEPTMGFEEYEPKSTLVVPEHPVTRARYPFIDVHNHQDSDEMTAEQVAELVAAMDGLNMAVMVNLSGGNGDNVPEGPSEPRARGIRSASSQFANVDFAKISEPGSASTRRRNSAADVKNGARGLKVFKNLGMFTEGRGRPPGATRTIRGSTRCGRSAPSWGFRC